MNNSNSGDKKLVTEIVIVLLVKLVLLFVIWNSFFSHAPADPSSHDMATILLDNTEKGETN